MSWNLSISDHHEDPAVNATVDALVRRLVDELVDAGTPASGSYSNGTTGESLDISIDEDQAAAGLEAATAAAAAAPAEGTTQPIPRETNLGSPAPEGVPAEYGNTPPKPAEEAQQAEQTGQDGVGAGAANDPNA